MRFCRLRTIIILSVSSLFALGLIVRAISLAHQKERQIQAVIYTILLVDKYVERTGKWPVSWGELEKIQLPGWSMFKWPRDSAEIRGLVKIDFKARLSDFANKRREDVTEIAPLRECAEVYKAYFDVLLTSIRSVKGRDAGGGPPKGIVVAPERPKGQPSED
jgi:hypothetical protein